MSYALDYRAAADAPALERAAFIRRTYAHLAGAILAFVGIEFLLISTLSDTINPLMVQFFQSRFSYLILFVGFIAVSYVADYWARSGSSPEMQYLGLGLYVVAEAAIFLPLLWIAANFFDRSVIPTAGLLTLAVFGGLTTAVLITRQDFSFLGGALSIGSWLALGLILASIFIGFNLGTIFMFFMVALASGYILYYTSNILHYYRTDQHVAAALALFAAVALLFWYILQIVMSASRR